MISPFPSVSDRDIFVLNKKVIPANIIKQQSNSFGALLGLYFDSVFNSRLKVLIGVKELTFETSPLEIEKSAMRCHAQ